MLRPWCHFDLPESDYIAGGRRAADMPGPTGALGPLDPATRVVELLSLGIRVANKLTFHVLNPTGVAYEFAWEQQGAAAAGDGQLGGLAGRAQQRRGPFVCDTRSGVIAGGCRSLLPTSALHRACPSLLSALHPAGKPQRGSVVW